MPELETERLTITSLTLDRVHAALGDRRLLADSLGVTVPDEWPNPEFAGLLPVLAHEFLEHPQLAVWSGLIIHRADATLIGDIGFKAEPDAAGSVEIGYSIVPRYAGHGYMTEAARAMVGWAFHQPGVRRVTAHCLNDNRGSIGVLEHLGMRQVGRNGPLLNWALERNRAPV